MLVMDHPHHGVDDRRPGRRRHDIVVDGRGHEQEHGVEGYEGSRAGGQSRMPGPDHARRRPGQPDGGRAKEQVDDPRQVGRQRFALPPPRKVAMSFEHARAIVEKALELGRPSIALAQALQFDCSLRQRDVIGEWQDVAELGRDIPLGGIQALGRFWTGGVTWGDVDGDLTLRKATTKTGAVGEWDLRRCPLVMGVLDRFLPLAGRVGPTGPKPGHTAQVSSGCGFWEG